MTLKDIPQTFQPDDDDEVRVAITQFFRGPGFELDEMSFEDKFVIKDNCKSTLMVESGWRPA